MRTARTVRTAQAQRPCRRNTEISTNEPRAWKMVRWRTIEGRIWKKQWKQMCDKGTGCFWTNFEVGGFPVLLSLESPAGSWTRARTTTIRKSWSQEAKRKRNQRTKHSNKIIILSILSKKYFHFGNINFFYQPFWLLCGISLDTIQIRRSSWPFRSVSSDSLLWAFYVACGVAPMRLWKPFLTKCHAWSLKFIASFM